VEFHLLKGPEAEDHTLYASHTVWENHAVFESWTRSEAFRAAHSRAGDNKPLYLDHPQFEGFEAPPQTVGRGKADMARTASTWHLEPFVTLNHFTVPLSTPAPLSENRMAAIN
jgi:hypothetical protein